MIFIYLLFPLITLANVMNLNNFMPTRLEDASPIEKNSFDAQFSSAFEKRNQDVVTMRPNIRYGLTNDIQLETQGTLLSGGKEEDHGETDFSVLYRIIKGKKLPSVALTPTLVIPTGKGQSGAELNFLFTISKAVRGTSDEPLTELHLNLGTKRQQFRGTGERGSVENFAAGVSHKLKKNMALIGDYIHQEDDEHKEILQLLELGLHTHLGKQIYLGLSYSQGFGKSFTRSGALVGLEKQFGP